MMALSEQQIEHYTDELRTAWNQWDPLGVEPGVGDGPLDEYDAYLGTTLALLVDGKPLDEVTEFLNFVIVDQMEIEDEYIAELQPEKFAQQLMAWFAAQQGAA